MSRRKAGVVRNQGSAATPRQRRSQEAREARELHAAVVVVAAGTGSRMGQPKQFLALGGKPMLHWTVDAFLKLPEIKEVVVVLSPEHLASHGREFNDRRVKTIAGGETRLDSVRLGVRAVGGKTEVLAVHDGARPLITPGLIRSTLQAAREHGAALPAVPMKDTLKEVPADDSFVSGTPDRKLYWAAQTPQCYRFDLLRKALKKYEKVKEASDESQLVEAFGAKVKIVESTTENLKVTTPDDLLFAEMLLKRRAAEVSPPSARQTAGGPPPPKGEGTGGERPAPARHPLPSNNPLPAGEGVRRTGEGAALPVPVPAAVIERRAAPVAFRTGFGYDIHRLVEGRPLYLGGVKIDHPKGLLGHSDGDVVLHAVCDALLGAASAGEIGQYFPPTDPSIAGIPSAEILRKVVSVLKSKRAWIEHVDIAVVAEQPKLKDLYPRLQASLSQLLRVPMERINLKAKSHEGLGEIGRGEAIACYAVANLTIR